MSLLITLTFLACAAIVGFALYRILRRPAKIHRSTADNSITDVSSIKALQKAQEVHENEEEKTNDKMDKEQLPSRSKHTKHLLNNSRTGHKMLRFARDVHHTQALPVHWLHGEEEHKIRKEGKHNHLSRDVGFVSLPLGLPSKSGFRMVKE